MKTIAQILSEELKQKPQVGDSVRLLRKLKGQSVINEIL